MELVIAGIILAGAIVILMVLITGSNIKDEMPCNKDKTDIQKCRDRYSRLPDDEIYRL